jgi:hypothetical protein
MPGDPGGDALERNALAWNTTYKALKTQLARHELSPSSAMFLVRMISFNVSVLLPMFDDNQNRAMSTMDEYFILDPTKTPREVIQFVELEVVPAAPAAAAKAAEAHAKDCLQALILFFSDNLSERGVGVSPVVSDFTAGGSPAQAALASAVAQDPANKRKAADAALAAAGRPHGENSAAINTEANTAQTRSRQAQPFEGEANARRGASFPPRMRFGRVIVRVDRRFRVSGFGKRFAPCPALLVFGKGRTCQTRPVRRNRPCACWERRSSSTEGVLHDGDTSCPSWRMLDTAGWRVRVLETKEFQCGGEGF